MLTAAVAAAVGWWDSVLVLPFAAAELDMTGVSATTDSTESCSNVAWVSGTTVECADVGSVDPVER